MEFFDPHFHWWDVSEQGFADGAVLFAPKGHTLYDHKLYEADVAAAAESGFTLGGGVYVECASVCFVDRPAPQHNAACTAEAEFVRAEIERAAAARDGSARRDYVAVVSCSLEDPDASAALAAVSAAGGSAVRGIRQIVNHEPSWPRNARTGDLLQSAEWRRGFGQMPEGWSFDLQANPHQFAAAAALFAGQPRTPVVIDHLGTPTLADITDPERAEVYWKGMQALADLPHVSVKISMLCYMDKDWDKNEQVCEAVHKVIAMFTPRRCMAASNYPVDDKDGWPAERLFPALVKLFARYSEAERGELFGGTARRVYRCPRQ